ncbi:MAG: ROK family protein [Planctomycetia bacterium]|nr:ROK family protein [Planctomycetia bacterium]
MGTERKFITRYDAQPPFFVGVDLGGTATKIGLVDDYGRILNWCQEATECENGPEDTIRRIGKRIMELTKEADLSLSQIARVGLGAPGILNFAEGKMVNPTNFPGWNNFPVRDILSNHCGMPVSFVNDASAAAYGEFWVGKGRMFHSMIMLTLGTGVGCGIIVGDLILEGENGHGTECGHIIVDSSESAKKCSCGQLGHLESYACAKAVVRDAHEILLNPKIQTSIRARLENGEPLTALIIGEEAEKGDEIALSIVMKTAKYIAIGLVSLLHTIDPSGILLGGSMTFNQPHWTLGGRFLERIRQEICQRTFPTLAENLVLEFASLGADAGFLGAAGVARMEFRRRKGPEATRQAQRSTSSLI